MTLQKQSNGCVFACDACFPPGTVDEIAEMGKGLWLIRDDESYSLLAGQGHRGDLVHTFPVKPIPMPDDDCPDTLFEQWLDAVESLRKLKVEPGLGHWLIRQAMRDGWDSIYAEWAMWVAAWCAKRIDIFERREDVRAAMRAARQA